MKDSAVYKEIVLMLSQFSHTLPERPVGMGNEVISGAQIVEMFFGVMKLPMPSPERIRSNTLSARVAGQTIRNGRTMLVTQLSGSLEAGNHEASMSLGWKGYTLSDVRTSLPVELRHSVTLATNNRNSGAFTLDVVTSLTSSP